MVYSCKMVDPTKLHAFIIHTKQVDRSKSLREQLKLLGIEFEMVESKSAWKEEDFLLPLHKGPDLYRHTIGRDLSLAELGGSLGHQYAYREIVSRKIPWGLIFEDDARLINKSFPFNLLDEFTKPTHINLAQHTRTLPKFKQKFEADGVLELIMPSTWAHAYLLNLEAAKKYEANFDRYGITTYPDWPYPQPKGIDFYISTTEFFGQEDPGISVTLTTERLKIPMENIEYSLVRPISTTRLVKRLLVAKDLGFLYSDIVYHELLLRLTVRISRAVKKCQHLLFRKS